MTQANGHAKAALNMTPSGSGQQNRSWFARHTKDVSDASLAQFERLMAAMGYRHLESTSRNTSRLAGSAR